MRHAARMRSKLALLPLLVLLVDHAALAQQPPAFPDEERWLLHDAFRVARSSGHHVWKDFNKPLFAVLLITPEHEFLVRHPNPPSDFTPGKKDIWLDTDIYFRKRVFAPNLQASFPVNGVPTVVIGQANAANVRDHARWILTLLHEHFHQLQDSQKNAFGEYDALGLARGDATGMWMLNFPFPYEDEEINRRFSMMCQALSEALKVDRRKQKRHFRFRVKEYLKTRDHFRQALSQDDYKYFSFQLWKEGLARYTEVKIGINYIFWGGVWADLWGTIFRKPDHESIGKAAREIEAEIAADLPTLNLKDRQRIAFYTFGAAEAMLLDEANANWKKRYFKKKFFLEEYYPRWAKKAARKATGQP